jgi:TRAP transporter TAXI family solute receptor
MTRRKFVCALAAVGIAPALAQQVARVVFMTAGQGSAFLPYGQGVAQLLVSKGIVVDVRESKGSNENLSAVDASTDTIGTVFMGSAYDAINGIGWTDRKHANLRALFPMYETSFQVAALRARHIGSIRDLDGRSVGVGPAKGPAEVFFRGVAAETKIAPVIHNGDPAELARQLLTGEIDALWQGALVPVPSLTAVTSQADAVVFGLAEGEVEATLKRFPQLSASTVPAGSYRGQTAALKSVSAWNFVIAHRDLADATAYAITSAVLKAGDPKAEIHPMAASTRAENAVANRIMAFHPGAARFYTEAGIKLAAP